MSAYHDFHFLANFVDSSLVGYCHAFENMLCSCTRGTDRKRDCRSCEVDMRESTCSRESGDSMEQRTTTRGEGRAKEVSFIVIRRWESQLNEDSTGGRTHLH